jgi:hypothetical protein
MKLIARIVEAGPPLSCEYCNTNWVTLEEDEEGITVGCPKCYEEEEL